MVEIPSSPAHCTSLSVPAGRISWSNRTVDLVGRTPLVLESTCVYPALHNGVLSFRIRLCDTEYDVWVFVWFRTGPGDCDGIRDDWFHSGILHV